MTTRIIIASTLLTLAACSPSQPPRFLPPATGSIIPQPVSSTDNYVPTGPDDGDNTDDDFAND